MIIDARSSDEIQRTLTRLKTFILLVYDSGRLSEDKVKYLRGLGETISHGTGGALPVIRVDLSTCNCRDVIEAHGIKLEHVPSIHFVLNGRRIWQQLDFFYVGSYDRLAIKRGILNALYNYGLRPIDLGFRLLF